jgi:uncharacterized protein YcbK (DUF882 family)
VRRISAIVMAVLACAGITTPLDAETPVSRTDRMATRKSSLGDGERPALLGTIFELHGDVRVPLDADSPSNERFSALLSDRVTGDSHELDAKLLGLLRALAEKHPGARVELVSGYRSPKLNEMLRKKGHHVASHSQHSLGHACDFRIVPPGAERGIHPYDLEKEIRALGWTGGVGVYPTQGDWFVHADVGPERRWEGN